MVTYGNMTGPNLNTYYYRVISLHSMRTVVFLDELNNIETGTGDIINTHLIERNKEEIIVNYRPEFAPFVNEGHLLLIKTDLYGLKSSGARFHSRLSYALTYLGFVPSMGVCDICMHNKVDYSAYMACYCDETIVMH